MRSGAEYRQDSPAVAASCGGDESFNGSVGSVEPLLRLCERCDSEREGRRRRQQCKLTDETNLLCFGHDDTYQCELEVVDGIREPDAIHCLYVMNSTPSLS